MRRPLKSTILFIKGQSLEIDLGAVKSLAEVMINGQSAGVVWKAPFRADITALVHTGANPADRAGHKSVAQSTYCDKQPNSSPVAIQH